MTSPLCPSDFPITPSLRLDEFGTELELKVPRQHDRLKFWSLLKNGERLSSKSEGQSGDVISKGYSGDQTDADLGLVIQELVETKTIPFEFKEVRLP